MIEEYINKKRSVKSVDFADKPLDKGIIQLCKFFNDAGLPTRHSCSGLFRDHFRPEELDSLDIESLDQKSTEEDTYILGTRPYVSFDGIYHTASDGYTRVENTFYKLKDLCSFWVLVDLESGGQIEVSFEFKAVTVPEDPSYLLQPSVGSDSSSEILKAVGWDWREHDRILEAVLDLVPFLIHSGRDTKLIVDSERIDCKVGILKDEEVDLEIIDLIYGVSPYFYPLAHRDSNAYKDRYEHKGYVVEGDIEEFYSNPEMLGHTKF